MYYRGAQAAIVVYDIQNQDSFQRAKTWVKELQRQVIIAILMIHCVSVPFRNAMIRILLLIKLFASIFCVRIICGFTSFMVDI